MKIVVLDGHAVDPGDVSWAGVEALGELTVYERTDWNDEGEIIRRIGDAEIVCANKTPIGKAVVDACPGMKLICVLATGYNVINCAYAGEKGIPVCNVPSYGTDSVAQFSIALLLELCHRIGYHDRTVHEGKWSRHIDFCYWDYPLVELAGKTMGIIGFGRIGRAEARIARAMGMKVLFYTPHPTDEGRALGEYAELDELYARSDVISLHCNLTEENRGMIDAGAIAKMKPGAFLINTARGQLLDEQAVADALNAGKLAGAAVDVVSSEPIREDNPLLTAKNCIITPHMAWGAREARQRILDTTAENIHAFLAGAPVNVVNAL